MQRAHKIRLYPTREQEVQLRKTAGTSRYAYNWALARWKEMYEAYDKGESEEKPSAFILARRWTTEREDWTKEVFRGVQTKAILNVGIAFQNLWKGKSKYPQFHKKGHKDTFYVDNAHAYIKDGRISLPKIGKVKLAEDLRYDGKIMSYTVSHYADQWHVSVQMETKEDPRPICLAKDSIVGIDVGLKNPAIASDGTVLEKPKFLPKLEQKLKWAQRKICRRQKGSNNRLKALKERQRIQQRINNVRKDAIHKFTTAIAKNHGIVVTESLDARSMQSGDNKLVRRGMAYSMMAEVIRQLSYKAQRHVMVDRYFPSTKKCSHCGHVKEDSLTLDMRTYTCDVCGYTIDRDLNAAINLMNAGKVILEVPVDSTASR